MVIISICVALSGTALALDTAYGQPEILDGGNGIFVIVGTDAISRKEYEIATEFGDIKKSDDGHYAMEIEIGAEKAMVPVGRLDVDLSDNDAVETVMAHEDISNTAKEQIAESLQKSAESVVIFSQLLLDDNTEDGTTTTLYSAPQKINNAKYPKISKLSRDNTNSINGIDQYSFTYITYSGLQMAVEQVTSVGLHIDNVVIASGNFAHTQAASWVNFSWNVAGLFTTMGFLQTGLSLLEHFINGVGLSVSSGNSEDIIYMDTFYNITYKNIFAVNSNGSLSLGAITRSALIRTISTRQYYHVNGAGMQYPSSYAPNSTLTTSGFSTPQYGNAYAVATSGQAAINEQIKYTIGLANISL
jgi:hypothetical protein